MSGLFNNLHQHHKDHSEERREARHGGRHDDRDDYNSQHHGQRHHGESDHRLASQSQFQGRGGGYTPPAGPPPPTHNSGFASQGGLDRGDFLSDAEIEQMVTSGEFDGRRGARQGASGNTYGRYDAPSGPPPRGRTNESQYGRYDPPSGPPPGQGYGERMSGYDAPSGPLPGRGYQSQQGHQEYGSGGAGYGVSDRPQQPQGRVQYESPQVPPPSGTFGRGQGNMPSGGFSASRDEEDLYGSGGPRNEPARRGEAASYYNQQDQVDRYTRLVGKAQEHGDDDPEAYHQATQGLHDRNQAQSQSRRRSDEDEMKAHVDAHRKAYGGDDHGPMDADAIGAAAAMEAFKQTAASTRSSNAPAGAFKTGGDSKPGRAAREEVVEEAEEEEEVSAARAGASGGLQDKLMALAMSHAGKLFDKKNAGSSGDKSQDKAQAMQSAATTAMQLFSQYQTNGKLETSELIGLAMKML